MHAELVEHVLGVGQNVHQMRDRRALIAADIRDAGLQQSLGDGENAFAAKDFALAKLEILDLASERAFRHRAPPANWALMRPAGSSGRSSASAYFLSEFPVNADRVGRAPNQAPVAKSEAAAPQMRTPATLLKDLTLGAF